MVTHSILYHQSKSDDKVPPLVKETTHEKSCNLRKKATEYLVMLALVLRIFHGGVYPLLNLANPPLFHQKSKVELFK